MKPGYSRLFIVLGLTFLGTAYASTAIGNSGQLSKVKLMATLNGQPALQEAAWEIYSLNDPLNAVATLPRHSGTVFLASGEYRAMVKLNRKTREQRFRVETDAENLIKVPMD